MVSLPSRFKKEPRHASPDSSVRTLVTSEHATPSTTSVNTISQTHFTDNEKDWELLEDESPMDEKETCSSPVELEVHPLREPKGVLVSVQPPKNPPASLGTKKRHPVDIVFVLDVSSSMDNPVKIPKASDTQPSGGSDPRSKPEQESYHSRLDLAKNAMRGIVSGLDDGDRVGIVCFGYDVEEFQGLTQMSKKAQEELLTKIDTIRAHGATNLWAGLRQGYRMLASENKRRTAGSPGHSLSAIYLLTDGLPNVMPPPEGYTPALQRLISKEVQQGKNPVIPSLHTFGFGYEIRSGLLQALAEVGGGYYAFIPEGSFVGGLDTIRPLPGAVASREDDVDLEISLYNLQYGQQHNIFLTSLQGLDLRKNSTVVLSATLEYTEPGRTTQYVKTVRNTSDISKSLPRSFTYYHLHRSMVCEFLASLSKRNSVDEYMPILEYELKYAVSRLEKLTERIESNGFEDELNKSLLRDLKSDMDRAHTSAEDPAGQIQKALCKGEWFEKWGTHYLPSVLHAYRNQLCLNEKDPGPKMYVANNALFDHFKQLQSDAWDTIEIRLAKLLVENAEAQKCESNSNLLSGSPPSYAASRCMPALPPAPRVSMAIYNNPDNPCFAAPSRILLTSGRAIPVRRLRPGVMVSTPVGPRRVAAVMKTVCADTALCRLGKLLVTPWHPVLDAGARMWVFPAQLADVERWRKMDVYSVLLERDGRPEAHAVNVGGKWCVTLGHGIVRRSLTDARGHEFLGDYQRVAGNMKKLPKGRGRVSKCGGMRRDDDTELVCGFEGPVGKCRERMRKRSGGKCVASV